MYKTYNNRSSSDEQKLIDAIVAATLEKQERGHKPGKLAQRDVHTKSHGTYKAVFHIREDLPQHLRCGLFAKPASYEAVVRFSNGAFPSTGIDALPNVRGVAVKLYDVSGGKMLPGEEKSTELDFLMANHPVFFAPRIEDMLNLSKGNFKALLRAPRVIGLMLRSMFELVKNPLQIDYFSQVPYAFGPDRACKFALLAGQKSPTFSLPNIFDRHYLRHAAVTTLKQNEARFVFAVQLQQTSPRLEPLEDSSIAWKGEYIPVADLVISRVEQEVQESDGEALSFNPMRTLLEHQALSWAGRVRRAVYAADFKWRSEHNK